MSNTTTQPDSLKLRLSNTTYSNGTHSLKTPKGRIPFGICAMAVGRDKWMREAKSKCPKCEDYFTASQFDGNAYCPECCVKELASY